jgi:hypothetical protein
MLRDVATPITAGTVLGRRTSMRLSTRRPTAASVRLSASAAVFITVLSEYGN